MREILIPMPRIARKDCWCAICDDELTPNLKVYMLGSYDARAHKFSAKYVHPQCAKRHGMVRDDHIVPTEKVLPFWKKMAINFAEASK